MAKKELKVLESNPDNLPVRRPAKAVIVDPNTKRALILRLEKKERELRGIDEWHIPGGSFEAERDANLEDTAKREVLEETGLEIEIIKELGRGAWNAFYEGQPTHFEAIFFLARPISNPKDVVLDTNEADDLAWVNEDDMLDYEGLTPQAIKYIPLGL